MADGLVVVCEAFCPACGSNLPDITRKLGQLLAGQKIILKELGDIKMSQAELDTDVQALKGALGTIQAAEAANTAAVQAVAAELAAAKTANPALDLSGLETLINGSADGTTPGLVQAAASVTAGVAAVQGLAPPSTPAAVVSPAAPAEASGSTSESGTVAAPPAA